MSKLLSVITMLVILLLSYSWVASNAVARAPVDLSINSAQEKEINLQTAEVKHGAIHKTVEAPGQVQPNAEQSVMVSTPSPGRAFKVIARLGDAVKQGQVLAVIKSDAIGQVQSDLLQNVLQAKADIKQQEVGLKLDKVTFDRESILYNEQVSAQADLQSAQNQLEKDEANLVALKAKLEAYIMVAQERLALLGAPRDSAAKVVANDKIDPWVIIRAPRNGVVIERNINPGELNDGSKELFILANLTEVWLVANVFEKDVELVKKAQESVVTLDNFPDHYFPAKIVWVGDTLNATTRTLPVRANVANPELILKPNMFARLKISVGNVSAMLVPTSSVMQVGNKNLVFVKVAPEKYQEREVRTGASDDVNTEITSGLNLGEQVVSNGAMELLGTAMKTSAGR